MPKKKDLIGMRFGRLVVTREAPSRYTTGGHSVARWYADCDCGNKDKIYNAGCLLSGTTKSCGCWNKELSTNKMKALRYKRNEFDLESKDYGIGWTLNTNEEFYFDKEDFELIKDYCWFKHRNYIEAKIRSTNKHIALHKLVMHDEDNYWDVDHINTDNHNDNRKCNLRVVTRSQNGKNKTKSKKNTSGCTGVVWHKRDKIWEASIRVDSRRIYLGRYENKEDAINARIEAERQYYGQYSYTVSQEIARENNIIK